MIPNMLALPRRQGQHGEVFADRVDRWTAGPVAPREPPEPIKRATPANWLEIAEISGGSPVEPCRPLPAPPDAQRGPSGEAWQPSRNRGATHVTPPLGARPRASLKALAKA